MKSHPFLISAIREIRGQISLLRQKREEAGEVFGFEPFDDFRRLCDLNRFLLFVDKLEENRPLYAKFLRQSLDVKSPDPRIASVALEEGGIVVTQNLVAIRLPKSKHGRLVFFQNFTFGTVPSAITFLNPARRPR